MSGRVSVVGAGPGDPGLLTLRAVRALETAEVVLYDALVSDEVLTFVPARCNRLFVGKRAGKHTMAQSDINALMIRLARFGKHVVRLKGGDPFVFGRGGEEALALREAGIPYEIVPGISSALAAAAYAGIPVTHRGISDSFTVATGHRAAGSTSSSHTRIFLMALSTLSETTVRLINEGVLPSTPAAIVEHGTLPEQRTITGTLQTIAGRARRAGLRGPSILIVGDVVMLHSQIHWRGEQTRVTKYG